jgi:hypothetical protein
MKWSLCQGLGSWINLLTGPEKNHHIHSFEVIFTIPDILFKKYIKFHELFQKKSCNAPTKIHENPFFKINKLKFNALAIYDFTAL